MKKNKIAFNFLNHDLLYLQWRARRWKGGKVWHEDYNDYQKILKKYNELDLDSIPLRRKTKFMKRFKQMEATLLANYI